MLLLEVVEEVYSIVIRHCLRSEADFTASCGLASPDTLKLCHPHTMGTPYGAEISLASYPICLLWCLLSAIYHTHSLSGFALATNGQCQS